MTEADISKAKPVKPDYPQQAPQPMQIPSAEPNINDFLIVLSALRLIKKHLTTAPTLVPKNFLDQIQFYDDGTNRRVYFYVNKTWRFVALT